MHPKKCVSFLFGWWIVLLMVNCSPKPVYPAPEKQQKKMLGSWSGILPCKECAGLDCNYSFYADHTFCFFGDHMIIASPHPEQKYEKGKWLLTTDSILLLNNENGEKISLGYFGDSLIYNHKKDKSPLFPGFHFYSFTKDDIKKVWYPMASHGYKFAAYGFQPAWRLDIGNDKSFNLTIEGKTQFAGMFGTVTKYVENVDKMVIEAFNESNQVKISAVKRTYQDTINNYAFPWTVTISVSGKSLNQTAEYTGGGKYLGEYLLVGRWYLSSIDKSPINGVLFPPDQRRPYLEFDPSENRISGFGGCSNFAGVYEADQDSVAFGQFALNQSDCLKRNYENEYIKKLKGNKFKWIKSREWMTFRSGKHELLFTDKP